MDGQNGEAKWQRLGAHWWAERDWTLLHMVNKIKAALPSPNNKNERNQEILGFLKKVNRFEDIRFLFHTPIK